MIEPFRSTFLTPTKKYRRLSILLTILDSSAVSQHKMAKMTHLSSSMVNNYIKELEEAGPGRRCSGFGQGISRLKLRLRESLNGVGAVWIDRPQQHQQCCENSFLHGPCPLRPVRDGTPRLTLTLDQTPDTKYRTLNIQRPTSK